MREFAKDWNRAIAKTVFRCAECGETAAFVGLVLRDSVSGHPSGADGGLITESGFFGNWEQVVLKAGLPAVAEAIAGEDARALHEIEPLWAPFYCPECGRCYCIKHWDMNVVFDSEWTSWYDYTEGICPRGHKRMIDD
jgi:hypothetical protein